MRRLIALVLLVAAPALAQHLRVTNPPGYLAGKNCLDGTCTTYIQSDGTTITEAGNVSVSGSLSASTVTASASVQTPDIKGAGGQDRILLPSGDTTTIKGGTNTANFVNVTGTTSGTAPSIAAAGSDTNISLGLAAKGTGNVNVTTGNVTVATGAKVCLDASCTVSLLGNGSATLTTTGGLVPATNNSLSLGTSSLRWSAVNAGLINLSGTVVKYNNVSTAALGVSPIYAYGTLTADTTTGTTITSYTVGASSGVFEAGGYEFVSAWTSGIVGVQLNFTDCHTVARSYNMAGESNGGGGNTTGLGATGSIQIYAQTFCAAAGSTITIKNSNTGTATADYFGFVRQVN